MAIDGYECWTSRCQLAAWRSLEVFAEVGGPDKVDLGRHRTPRLLYFAAVLSSETGITHQASGQPAEGDPVIRAVDTRHGRRGSRARWAGPAGVVTLVNPGHSHGRWGKGVGRPPVGRVAAYGSARLLASTRRYRPHLVRGDHHTSVFQGAPAAGRVRRSLAPRENSTTSSAGRL